MELKSHKHIFFLNNNLDNLYYVYMYNNKISEHKYCILGMRINLMLRK